MQNGTNGNRNRRHNHNHNYNHWYYFSVICGAAFFSAWSVLRFTIVAQSILLTSTPSPQEEDVQQLPTTVLEGRTTSLTNIATATTTIGTISDANTNTAAGAATTTSSREGRFQRFRKRAQRTNLNIFQNHNNNHNNNHYDNHNNIGPNVSPLPPNNNNNNNNNNNKGPKYSIAKVESKIDTTFEATFDNIGNNKNGISVTVGRQGEAVKRAILYGMAQRNQGSHRSTWDRIENPTCLIKDNNNNNNNNNMTTTPTTTTISYQAAKQQQHQQQQQARRMLMDSTTTNSTFTNSTSPTITTRRAIHRRRLSTTITTTQLQQQQRNPQSPIDFLPQAILIGVQKGGTTALYTYLDQHPDIAHSTKELYFLDEKVDSIMLMTNYDNNIGIPQHDVQIAYGNVMKRAMKQPFDRDAAQKMILDLTPNYLFYGDRLPQRLRCIIPDAKIFCLLRNPIDRARSQYDMKYQFNSGDKSRNPYGYPVPTFDEYIQNDLAALQETGVIQDWNVVDFDAFFESDAATEAWRTYVNSGLNAPIGMGLYAMQLRGYGVDFLQNRNSKKQQFLAIPNEQLQYNTSATYNHVLNFLGLPPLELKTFPQSNHAKVKKAVVSDTTRKMLQDVIRPFHKKLQEMLGGEWKDIEWE